MVQCPLSKELILLADGLAISLAQDSFHNPIWSMAVLVNASRFNELTSNIPAD